MQIPEAALDDMRRRINATRWPDRETVADRSQGIQLAELQQLGAPVSKLRLLVSTATAFAFGGRSST